MEHLVKLLRDSYDLQEEKSEETAYWHLQKLRSEIKQLTLTYVVDSEAKLLAFSKFLLDRSYVRGRYYPKTLVKLFKGK